MSPEGVRRVIGYTRVSTTDQGQSGAGLKAQEQAIRAYAKMKGWRVERIATDVASGKSLNGRHALHEALADLKAHKADAIVVARLDRISRSVADFAKLLDTARKQRWSVIAIDINVDTSTAAGEMVVGVLMALAQWERRVIGERTKAALAVKKSEGVRLGRVRTIAPDVERRIKRLRRGGLSLRDIAAKLNAEGRCIPPSGGAWSFTTIADVAKRPAVRV